jgi:hypothetical protein
MNEPVRGDEGESVDVATSVIDPALEEYTRWPSVRFAVVERPPQLTMFDEKRTGHVADTVACLLLKVVQSPELRHPVCDPSAAVHPIVRPDPMMLCPAVAVIPPDPEIVPVATFPSVAGVPFVLVQYASCPAVSPVDVARGRL